MIIRVIDASFQKPYKVYLKFNDGVEKTVDLAQRLNGPVFQPLKDPEYFCKGRLDPLCGTIVWPNGADFAPEMLHELSDTEFLPPE